jgi:ubiquinone/menaquinone biosynthesis C-methylase UbiE
MHLPRTSRILDFGCGVGRFTERLTAYADDVIGVEIARSLLELAPRNEHTRYIIISSDRLPFEDSYFDLVWINSVLGGITNERLLYSTVSELERVSTKGGQLFLTENTTTGRGPPHWRFRTVSDYLRLFPNYRLNIAAKYNDAGEEMTVFVGRKGSSFCLGLVEMFTLIASS